MAKHESEKPAITLEDAVKQSEDDAKEQQPNQSPAAPVDMDKIDTMDAEQLRKLIRRVAGAIWGYALSTDQERAEAMKLRLAHIALTGEIKNAIVAIDKWLSRVEGMPTQTTEHKGAIGVYKINPEEEARALQQIRRYQLKHLEN